MLRSSSFLKRTVWTPEIALTTVDLPCATWPIVPVVWVEGVNECVIDGGRDLIEFD